jgi:hypothetical protein
MDALYPYGKALYRCADPFYWYGEASYPYGKALYRYDAAPDS